MSEAPMLARKVCAGAVTKETPLPKVGVRMCRKWILREEMPYEYVNTVLSS